MPTPPPIPEDKSRDENGLGARSPSSLNPEGADRCLCLHLRSHTCSVTAPPPVLYFPVPYMPPRGGVGGTWNQAGLSLKPRCVIPSPLLK